MSLRDPRDPLLPVVPADVEAAALALNAELGKVMNQFTTEHAALIRVASDVPASVQNLTSVVVCAFLGYCLELLRNAQGTEPTERLVFTMLEKLEQAAVMSSKAAEGRQ